MGQYYTFTNFTRKESAHVGKFEGNWEYYLNILGWSKTDNVVAHGDYGNVIHMNPEAPDIVQHIERDNAENIWSLCVFAAKKLGVDPRELYEDYIREDSFEESEMRTLDFRALEKAHDEKRRDVGPQVESLEV